MITITAYFTVLYLFGDQWNQWALLYPAVTDFALFEWMKAKK